MVVRRALVTVGLLSVALLSGIAGSAVRAATRPPSVGAARNSVLGEILVSGGRTLYRTTAEQRHAVRCTGACARTWPPLVLSDARHAVAGTGARAQLLGTIRRPDGRIQVTYAGFPLYFFSADRRPGDAAGEGAGARWYAVAPSGALVKTATSGTPASPTSGSSTTGSSAVGSSMTTSPGGASTDTSAGTTGSGPPTGVNAGMWCAANPKSCVNGVPVTGGQSG